jgi:pentatricopeptide repeat protein
MAFTLETKSKCNFNNLAKTDFFRIWGDKFTFSLILKACSQVGLVKEGMQIHGLLKNMEFGLVVFLQNCVIWLYLRCGFVEIARQVFGCMPVEEKNLISWNSMISGYVQSKDGLNVAWELFEKMPARDLVSCNTMIDGCVIPLTKMPGTIGLRSVVAVKLNSTLEISAHLWNSSTSNEIVNGIACFPAVLASTSKEESIYGMHGEIKLKLTWNKDLWTV